MTKYEIFARFWLHRFYQQGEGKTPKFRVCLPSIFAQGNKNVLALWALKNKMAGRNFKTATSIFLEKTKNIFEQKNPRCEFRKNTDDRRWNKFVLHMLY